MANSLALATFLFFGSFSRLTHGRYTPQMYAYQLDRSPDDGTTTARIIPLVDLTLGIAITMPQTRIVAQWMVAAFFAIGVLQRLRSGRRYVADMALFLWALGSALAHNLK